MKTKNITLLLALGLLISGCGTRDKTTGGVFSDAKKRLYKNHNYTVKVVTKVEGDEDSPYTDRFYNINNKAYFSVDSEYPMFYTGMIYQKEQGYVDFDLLIEGTEVVPNNFYSTNTKKSVSDIYTLSIERVLDGKFTKEGDKYSCSEKDPIAVMTNLSGFDTTYISAPKKIYATVDKSNNLKLTSTFTMRYIDPSTYERVTKEGSVTVTFEKIDNTHNKPIEDYIKNPTTTFTNRVDWTEDDRKEFKSYFNERIPPFLEGSSYSLKVGDHYDGYNQEKYAIVEDYSSGDLSQSYGLSLFDAGFSKVDDYHYKLEQIFASGSMKETYYVDMVFTGPNEIYSGDRTIGHYFPKGVFTVKYRYKTQPTEDINSIAKLNTHISKSKARTILPAFPDNGEIDTITNFEDRTSWANQYYSPEERAYLFVTSISSLIVKLHASKENANAFIENLTPLMEAKGFAKNVDTRYGQISYIDSQQSKVVLTDPNYEGAPAEGTQATYPGYIQLQIVIYNNYGEIVDPSEVLDKLTLSNQTTAYHVGDRFKFDGIVTAHYQSGDTKVVIPNSVTSPDMSTAGDKVVTVTYIEDGQVVTKGYVIHVTYPDSATAKTITYASGFEHEAIQHIDLSNSTLPERAEPGSQVTMTVAVESGYRFGCYYPNDEIGDVWAEFDDEVKLTQTITFTMPNYSFEMILIVEIDDGSPRPDYPLRMEISGYTTEWYEYDDFSFDGTCIVTYESGETANVTPTITSYPNMSQQGTQTVRLEYFESGVTVKTSYEITVTERPPTPTYSITYGTFDGAQISNMAITSPSGASQTISSVEEGSRITFNVAKSSGFTVNSIYYILNGERFAISQNPMNQKYSFQMPAGDITLCIDTTPPEILQNLDGNFAYQADSYNVYEFYFDSVTRTGTYTRTRTNSGGSDSWSLIFSFSYLSGNLTLTLTSFATGCDNTDFVVGYRLFASGTIGSTNTTLTMNEEHDTITLTMYKSTSTTDTESHSFYKY